MGKLDDPLDTDIEAAVGGIGRGRASHQQGRSARRAAAEVYDALRQEIIGLVLVPGTILNRLELQDRFGLSSTPVRDALIRLGEENLVDIVAQSATRVSLIDMDDARQAQFLRRALEQEAVESLCLAADRTVTIDLKALIAEQGVAARQGDLATFEQLDRQFHRRIFEAAGVAGLHDMSRRRSGHIDRIRQLHLPQAGRTQDILNDHEAIVAAIKAGDAVSGRRAIRDHLSQSLAYSATLRERHPRFFR